MTHPNGPRFARDLQLDQCKARDTLVDLEGNQNAFLLHMDELAMIIADTTTIQKYP